MKELEVIGVQLLHQKVISERGFSRCPSDCQQRRQSHRTRHISHLPLHFHIRVDMDYETILHGFHVDFILTLSQLHWAVGSRDIVRDIYNSNISTSHTY